LDFAVAFFFLFFAGLATLRLGAAAFRRRTVFLTLCFRVPPVALRPADREAASFRIGDTLSTETDVELLPPPVFINAGIGTAIGRTFWKHKY
jgi:hypothetical protein